MIKSLLPKHTLTALLFCGLTYSTFDLQAQTLAFPEATGFGRFTTGARGATNPQVYLVTNLNDSGPGSFRDAVSQPGRFVIFKVGGIVNLQSIVAVAANTTIAGQTAPGEGIVFWDREFPLQEPIIPLQDISESVTEGLLKTRMPQELPTEQISFWIT